KHARPTSRGSVVPAQRLGRTSPSRKTVEASWKSRLPAPVSHLAVPLAGVAIVLRTQVLRGGVPGFGTGRGGPKRQPTSVQSRSLPVSAGGALAGCHPLPGQPVALDTGRPLSGVRLGGCALIPPPT